jgi:hypothetical protein
MFGRATTEFGHPRTDALFQFCDAFIVVDSGPTYWITMSSQTHQAEKRLSGRAKLSKMLRARPSEARDEHFADLSVSVNISKSGLYFHTHRRDYYKGMRLFVTFPFTFANDPMNCEYLAEVVRVEICITTGTVLPSI